VGRADAPILIDQEGGRVQRLGPPHWGRYPPGRAYGQLKSHDPEHRREIVRLGARLLAHDLAAVGVSVDCLPVLDVPDLAAHPVIGDRAYADKPGEVALLGRAAAEGLLAGGVLPVVKHIPGHGRALADSHEALPVVEASWEALDARDFAPFRALSDMPMAMTAHVIYAAIDRRRPATTSRSVVRTAIRGAIGFAGLLMSDDLSMRALDGGLRDRAEAARAAGCDVVLHCNGDLGEMAQVAAGAGRLSGAAARRAEAALARRPKAVEPFDAAAGRARFDSAFEGRFAA
jgi:beta-N-acetylhexosaminidase